MRLRWTWFLCFLLAALFAVSSVQADTRDWFKGSYSISMDGKEVAKERFVFRSDTKTGALFVSGDIGGKLPSKNGLEEFSLNTHLTLKPEMVFKKYKQWVLTGTRRKQDVFWPFKGQTRLSWGKWGGAKAELIDVSPPEGFLMHHARLFHFYSLFARRYGDTVGPMNIPCLNALNGRSEVFHMERVGVGALKGKKGVKEFSVIRFQWGTHAGRLFSDKSGRVHRVELGDLTAMLKGYKTVPAPASPPAETE